MKRHEPPRHPIPEPVREEIDQTPEWWDRQYRALVRARIPKGGAYHDGHNIAEIRTFSSTLVRRECIDCGITLDPYDTGEAE